MSNSQPVKRAYNSTRRRERALQTRQAIAQAALRLFKQRGYRGASIDAIAEATPVAPETIYATFGSKRELLHYLLDISLGGDEAPLKIIDRPEVQTVLYDTDARRVIAGFSNQVYTILTRAAPVFAILAEAAKTDADLNALQNRFRAERLDNMHRVARAIARNAPLRVDEDRAAETLWALTSWELFLLLTDGRQWGRKQYAVWLQDSLQRLLLADGAQDG